MKTKPQKTKKHVIIRAAQAGVFAGFLKERTGGEVTLTEARRLWYWDGAASLSQLAMEGTNAPRGCKFTQPVDEIIVLGVIEIIPTTAVAQENINSVPVWKR